LSASSIASPGAAFLTVTRCAAAVPAPTVTLNAAAATSGRQAIVILAP
jgi:hypothetical protein